MGARAEAKRERLREQLFVYGSGANRVQTPIIGRGFVGEDGALVAQPNLTMKVGDRLMKTNAAGVIFEYDDDFFEDRATEQDELNDRVYSNIQLMLRIENDDVIRELLGVALFKKAYDGNCLPSLIAGMPVESLIYAEAVKKLKDIVIERNMASNKYRTIGIGQPPIGQNYTTGAVAQNDVKSLIALDGKGGKVTGLGADGADVVGADVMAI